MHAFESLWAQHGGAALLHGDCPDPRYLDGSVGVSVDQELKRWALAHEIPAQSFPPDWQAFGKSAGPRRNAELVAAADLLVAFTGGKGTANCIAAAKRRGIPVYVIETGGEVRPG